MSRSVLFGGVLSGTGFGSTTFKLAISVFVLFSLTFGGGAQAREVAGVEVAEKLVLAGHDLVLNGAGVRDKWFVDVYVGALYLQEPMDNAQAIIAADEPMAIRLIMVSGMVTSQKMKDATLEGFEKAMDGDTSPIQSEVDRFLAGFDEKIEDGDVFDIIHDPAQGILVHKNGKDQGIVAKGDVFKQAVFGIWLSDDPVQGSLKQRMMGD